MQPGQRLRSTSTHITAFLTAARLPVDSYALAEPSTIAPRQVGLKSAPSHRRKAAGHAGQVQGRERGLQGQLLRDGPLHHPQKSSHVALLRKP